MPSEDAITKGDSAQTRLMEAHKRLKERLGEADEPAAWLDYKKAQAAYALAAENLGADDA